MKILAIETSCDETGAAIVEKNPTEDSVKILSNVIASSLILHSKTGGIIPDIAAREQLKFIIPVIKKAIDESKISIKDIDAIAVTNGPGLIGSLLVGVETARTLAYLWNKPIIPVNHLLGHIYANFITTTDYRLQNMAVDGSRLTVKKSINFPSLALLVSGGHTDLALLESHKAIKWIGGTLDDAAGEAFDKIGRLLDLPYPGGPSIEKVSKQGDASHFTFPRPMIGSKDFNFSFSGLKAAVTREVLGNKNKVLSSQYKCDIAAAVQKSIIEVLVRKTAKAAKQYNVKSILLGGGVASNKKLQRYLKFEIGNLKLEIKLFVPPKSLCTDNAAMIGAYAAFHFEKASWKKVVANPQLYFD